MLLSADAPHVSPDRRRRCRSFRRSEPRPDRACPPSSPASNSILRSSRSPDWSFDGCRAGRSAAYPLQVQSHEDWQEAALEIGDRQPIALDARPLQPGTIAPTTPFIGPSAKGRLDRRRLFRVLDYIDRHLEGDLTLDSMASVACLSRFHFARAFKRAVGQSPLRYVMARRLERAKVLLTEGEAPLVEIALALQFSSQANFTRAFRQSAGMAPGQYRREVTAASDMNALRVRSCFKETELPRTDLGKAFDELGSQLRLRGRAPNAINTRQAA
jgi:AraC-like DNA-binding protein